MGKPKRIKVFVSSTQGDLREQHEQVVAVIEAFPLLECVTQLRFTAEVVDTVTGDADKIRDCGLVIFLLGHRYGSIAPGHDKSFVELEYEAAIEHEKDHLVFFYDEEQVSPDTRPGQRNVDDGADWQMRYDRQKSLKRRATASGGPQATPITARNLLPKLVAALFQWAAHRRHQLVSAPERSRPRKGDPSSLLVESYRADIHAAYGHLRLVGMPHNPGMPVRLADLYVPMLARERGPGAKGTRREHAGMTGDAATLPLNLVFASGTRRAFVLLGLPGSGKKTYLRMLALACASSRPPAGLPEDTLPVYLPLRELRAEEVDVGFEHLLARA